LAFLFWRSAGAYLSMAQFAAEPTSENSAQASKACCRVASAGPGAPVGLVLL
jgi:hypothetical protein